VNEGILLVGAAPSPSPFAASFDPTRIPRIRSTSWRAGRMPLTGRYWLDYLDAHPERRYISAGNPGHLTLPKADAGILAPRYRRHATLY
jgi:hypothetical protein